MNIIAILHTAHPPSAPTQSAVLLARAAQTHLPLWAPVSSGGLGLRKSPRWPTARLGSRKGPSEAGLSACWGQARPKLALVLALGWWSWWRGEARMKGAGGRRAPGG